MNNTTLLFALFFIFLSLILSEKNKKDTFSLKKILGYSILLELIILILNGFVFSNSYFCNLIPAARCTSSLIEKSNLLIFVVNFSLFVSIGLFDYLASKNYLRRISFSWFSVIDEMSEDEWWIIWLAGVNIFILYFNLIGGIDIWDHIDERTTRSIGFGYLVTSSNFLISLGMGGLYVKLYPLSKWKAFFVVITSIVLVSSLSQRFPAGLMIYFLLLLHHYKFKCVRLFSLQMNIILLACLTFMILMVQVRKAETKGERFLDNIQQNLVNRLGNHDKYTLVLDYFSQNDFWRSGVYKSLIYAPLLRSRFKEKPPIDTGLYLNAISQGKKLNPPVPANTLDRTSLPDGYLAGYVSYGWFGIIALIVTSSFFTFLVSTNLNHGKSLFSIFLYSNLTFLSIRALDPFSIVSILVLFLFTSLLILYILLIRKFRFKKIKGSYV